MKKLKSFLFFLFLQSALLAGAKSFEFDGIKYNVIDGTSTVEVGKTKKNGKIVIPEEVSDKKESYRVVAVAPKAFEKKKESYSIVLPSSVATLGERAFTNSALTDIEMPGVSTIGPEALEMKDKAK